MNGPKFALIIAAALTMAGFALLSSNVQPQKARPATSRDVQIQEDELLLTVQETAGVARSNEVVRSGAPLARSLNITTTVGLAVVDATGAPVPAEFQVLARWNAGKNDLSAPIQWLLLAFPASAAANSASSYRLVTDGSQSNPAPATLLSLSQSAGRIKVDTGAATFSLGSDPAALFDEIRLADGTVLASGGDLTARIEGTDANISARRRISVEHAGPLAAVVVVESVYDLPAVGGGQLSTRLRYSFRAGSPTAIVRQAINWEGSRCESSGYPCDWDNDGEDEPNGLLVEQVRDTLPLSLAGPYTVTAVGAFGAASLQAGVNAGQTASVNQRQRSSRQQPLAFDIDLPGTPGASGEKADGALLAAGNETGTIAVALNHMHRYEPQSLRLLADGSLALDIAADHVWLAYRQGLFATLAVSALPGLPDRADLERLAWAPLSRPLRAWPSPAWFAASGAVDEFPVGPLPANLARYDMLVEGVLSDTLSLTDDRGLAGLMTFGVYPRYWGTDLYGDELDCNGDDPTPNDDWDDIFWCGSWSDYHNTLMTVPIWAMRSGQVEWLDELGLPGALRTLHTQIIQCGPDDDFFYCGQAPAGYGGYRDDFNSSHAYFDNLMLSYWLTGDADIVETLQRGASSMRNFLCSRRPAEPCLPNDPPDDYWAQFSGRVASQWLAAFRFVGLAGADPGYLADWESGLARALTQHYVESIQNGTAYGFWLDGGDLVAGPGSYASSQLWMASLYDMNNLYRLQQDTNDAPLGDPALPPSQAQIAWARTLVDFGSTVAEGGDGTAAGAWPNVLDFTWTGPRIGGSLESVAADPGGGDPVLWDTGKANLTALLVRAGEQSGDPALTQMGADLTQHTLDAALADGSPLGKPQGLYLARLHAAVARLSSTAPGPTETPTPTPTATLPGSGPTPTPTGTPVATGSDLLLHTTLDDATAIASPRVGLGGSTTLNADDFEAGQIGQAARFTDNSQIVTFPAAQAAGQNIELDRGEIDLWYRPAYDAATDDINHDLLVAGDIYGVPRLSLSESDRLSLTLVDASWQAYAAQAPWRASLWTAGEWVRIHARWDTNWTTDSLRIYINEERVDEGGPPGGWMLGDEAGIGDITIGTSNGEGAFPAAGLLDELVIRAAPPAWPPACAPEANSDGWVDIVDIQRRAAAPVCQSYLALLAGYWRLPWP